LQHVNDHRQVVKIRIDRIGKILSLTPRIRQAHCDEFADVTHRIGRQDGLRGRLESRQPRNGSDWFDSGQIGGKKHLPTPVLRNLDFTDGGVSDGAANEGNITYTGELDIGDELATAAQKSVILFAQEPCADPKTGHRQTPEA
jgi:hypothetical protein